jgi:hypothetical protein
MKPLGLTIVLAVATVGLAWSAQAAEPVTAPSSPCNKAQPAEAATPPNKSASSGTAPGDSGSTGWSGGTGGSNIGTSQDGPTPGSPNSHPETAKGLDPTKPSTANPAATNCG